MFNHYGVDADLGIQVDDADAIDREDPRRANQSA
jgi:hypothetical protein